MRWRGFEWRAWAGLVATGLLALVFAAPASAANPQVYWVNNAERTIGSADLDSGNQTQLRIDFGYYKPTRLVVGGEYVYWIDPSLNSIGRAKLDGSAVQRRFLSGISAPCGLAVDGSHIYWTTEWTCRERYGEDSPLGAPSEIGRANLDGSQRDDSFITGLPDQATDVAVDDEHLFWIWTEYESGPGPEDTATVIGRADLDGDNVDTHLASITNPQDGSGSYWHDDAIAAADGHIYWTNMEDDSNGHIVRATTSGTSVEPDFVTDIPKLEGDLATDADHLYWVNNEDPSGEYEDVSHMRVGQVGLDGTGLDRSFGAVTERNGIAVDGASMYWTTGARSMASPIIRADLDGGNPDTTLFPLPDVPRPEGLIADSQFVYWIDGSDIARANRDGTGVNRHFMATGTQQPTDLTIDSKYLYWSYWDGLSAGIGRAGRDGASPNPAFVTGVNATGVAVDALHLYWTTSFPKPEESWETDWGIGRAGVGGTSVNDRFITGLDTEPVMGSYLADVQVDDSHIFWIDENGRKIGRANLDGSAPTADFIDGTSESDSLSLTNEHIYWNGGRSSEEEFGGTLVESIAAQRAPLNGSGSPTDFVDGDGSYISSLAIARDNLTTPVEPEIPPSEPGPSNPASGAGATQPSPTKPRQPKATPPPKLAVKLSAPKQRLGTISKTGVIRARCRLAAAGRCAVVATISVKDAKALGLKVKKGAKAVTIGSGKAALDKSGTVGVKVKLSRTVLNALKGATKLKVRLTVTASGPGRKTSSKSVNLTARP